MSIELKLKVAIIGLWIVGIVVGYAVGRAHEEYLENKRLKERQKLKKV